MICALAAAADTSEVFTWRPTVMTRSRLGSFTAVFDVPDPAAPLPLKADVPPGASCFEDSGACADPAAARPWSGADEEAFDPLLPPLHAVSATGPAMSSASNPAATPARGFPLRMSSTIRA